MTKYKARILPDHLHASNIGDAVPIIIEHNLYGRRIGTARILDQHFAQLDSEELNLGDKLSAGSFVVANGLHQIREVSLTQSPKYKTCEVLDYDNTDDIRHQW